MRIQGERDNVFWGTCVAGSAACRGSLWVWLSWGAVGRGLFPRGARFPARPEGTRFPPSTGASLPRTRGLGGGRGGSRGCPRIPARPAGAARRDKG